jgi:hypothetical protein
MYRDDITPSIISPRNKREKTAIHYSKALNGLVNYFDAPDSTVEFIEACIALHGYNSDDFWIATGEDLARALATASTVAQIDRVRDRLAKQRKRLSDWQNSRDSDGLPRPMLVSIRCEYLESEKQWRYEYGLPIAGLIRQIIIDAPVGATHKKLKSAVGKVAKDYLMATGLRPPSRTAKRLHTPKSQVNRGLSCLISGYEKMSENEFQKTVENAISENPKLLEIFKLPILTIGKFPMLFPANLAYTNTINTYAKNEENGAAGGGAGDSWFSGQFEEPSYFADRFDEVAR